ncbi:MAG TPA: hypothetical protein EYQ21_00995 [Flavobacteriales bacterium]|nr:hypothetical protein [Flavobacteriales bacterium]
MRPVLTKLFVSLSFLASFNVYAASTSDPDAYIFEGGQSLIDLYSDNGATNMNACDDCVSGWSPDFGFDFDIFGQTYRKAKMSTNGCVNFTGLNCQDYTPQPLPYRDKTLYPFWTDLIRGAGVSGGQSSKMRFKAFNDYVVFGWYYMREYNRTSSNSFEAILYANDTYEYRYRELDIINHDVLIGEQNTSSDHKTYRFYDDNTGGHNTWDSYDASFGSSKLEDGGSLYSGSFEDMCSNNQLYNSSCSGYAAAYLAQQCGISALYSTSCSGYAAAYLAQQCGLSALYNISCSGYAAAYFSQQCGISALYDTDCTGYSLAYYTQQCSRDALYDSGCDGYWEEIAYQASLIATTTDTSDQYGYDGSDDGSDDGSQYGYDDSGVAYTTEDLWYDEEYDEYLDPNDPCYQNGCENMTDADWYALDIEQFGQEQVDEWYGDEVEFSSTGTIDYAATGVTEEEYWTEIDSGMEIYDVQQEAIIIAEELAWEQEIYTFIEDYELVQELAEETYEESYEEYELAYEEAEEAYEEYEEAYEEYEEALIEELEEYEEVQLAQLLLDDVDIFILQEETGIELLREEEWQPQGELEIYEEVLEDYERDALEELEDEIYEEFIDEIDEELLEELTDEEDLDDEIDEEFFEEAEDREDELKEDKKESRVSRRVSRKRVRVVSPTRIASSSSASAVSNTGSYNTVAQVSSGVSTSQQGSQQQQQQYQGSGQQQQSTQVAQETGQQQTQDTSSNEYTSNNSTNSIGNSSIVTNSTTIGVTNEYQTTENNQLFDSNSNNIANNTNSGISNNEIQNYDNDFTITAVGVDNFDNIGEVSAIFTEPMMEVAVEEVSIETTFAEVSVEFEQTFNDALGAGQSIGQFLSNEVPSFSNFNIEPPTMEQTNTIAAVESLADRVGTEQAEANLQEQFETLEANGGFGDQTIAVAFIGYAPGFSAYTNQAQMTDKLTWYRSTQLPSPDVVDNNFSFYMMAGNADKKIAEMRR